MRSLPVILDQGQTPTCTDYAVSGVANYFLGGDKVDAAKLHGLINKNGANTFTQALEYVKNWGFPMKDGTSKKIKGYTRHIFKNFNDVVELVKTSPILFSLEIPSGKTFDQSVDPTTFIYEYPLHRHSMIILDADPVKKVFKIANSWGNTWKDHGYFYIPYMQMTPKFIAELFTFGF